MTPPAPNADGPASARSSLPVLALGANTWLVAAGWPLLTGLTGQGVGLVPWSVAALALAALGAGALLHGRGAPRLARARDAAWWLAFPIATSAATASAYDAVGEGLSSSLPLLLAPLSACGFGAALVVATSPAPRRLAVELTPLRALAAPRAAGLVRAALPRVLLGTGAVALGLVLPALCDPAELAERWGDAGRQGAVLSAIVGGALGVAVLASFLPAALRQEPSDAEPRADAALRTGWYLLLSLLGAVTYYVVQP